MPASRRALMDARSSHEGPMVAMIRVLRMGETPASPVVKADDELEDSFAV